MGAVNFASITKRVTIVMVLYLQRLTIGLI